MDESPVNPYAAPRVDAAPAGRVVLTDAQLRAFLGGEDAYHEVRLDRANESGRWYAGFNWACAVFGSLWMFYRRMPIEGAVVFVLGLALRTPYFQLVRPHLTQQVGVWVSGMGFLANCVVVGFLGNPLLLRKARVLVTELRQDLHRDVDQALRWAGRPSRAALGVGILAEIGVTGLLAVVLRLI